MLKKKLYIVIEGCDGAGKTTLAKKIAQKLNFKYGIRCMCTNEPHTKIRNTKNNIEDIKQYAKDRLKWQQSIQTKAEIIIQDRSLYSSYVNNVQTPAEKEAWHYYNKHVIRPDIVIFLNTRPKVCVEQDMKKNDAHTLEEIKLQQRKYLEILPPHTWYMNNNTKHERGYIVDMIVDKYNQYLYMQERR